MGPNLQAHRNEFVGGENPTSSKSPCDACDAVTAAKSDAYPPKQLGTLVTRASVGGEFGTVELHDEIAADMRADLDEREAMALEGGVPPAFAHVFAALQVARPASVAIEQSEQAINDIGVFLDTWGGTAEGFGWNAREIIGPQFTPTALAWALKGSHVVSLTATHACLSDGRMFIRVSQEVSDEQL